MESIQGKHALVINAAELQTRLTGYEQVLIDLGTGDGRFVEHVAHAHPDRFVIGLDACRENLRKASCRAPCNALYLIANALALPADLQNLATEVTINFPWGSLLEGLLAGEVALLEGLAALARPGAHLTVRLNGGALAEAGWSLPDGAAQVQRMLSANGFTIDRPVELEAAALRQLPTTWAKRLAFGRDPRALLLSGKRTGSGQLAAPLSLKTTHADGNLCRRLTASNNVNTLVTTTAMVITSVAYGPHIDLPIVLRQDQSARSQRAVNSARDFERSHPGRVAGSCGCRILAGQLTYLLSRRAITAT